MITDLMLSDFGFAIGIGCVLLLGIAAICGVLVVNSIHDQKNNIPHLCLQLRAKRKVADRTTNTDDDKRKRKYYTFII